MTDAGLRQTIAENPFVLAPMAGITDCAFRSFMREMGASVVVTELVSATGLAFKSDRTRQLMRFKPDQHPIGIQIFGEEIEHLASAAQEIEQMGADFVDLNFGCPVPKVVKKGAGSAVLKDLLYMRDILRAVKGAVKIPVTIKVRTGWDEASRNTNQVVQIAHDEGICWVAIHGRTRAAGYSGRADWEYIAKIKAESPLPIIGNGDILTPDQAVARLRTSGCDAVMIGRGCLKNPWIFRESLQLRLAGQYGVEKNFPKLFARLLEHFAGEESERIVTLQMKKFAAWYSSGYPGSGQFRKSLFALQTRQDLLDCALEYFSPLSQMAQADTSHESFLMGGHG